MKSTSLHRANAVLLCGILIVVVLYYARYILIPVTSAAMLAMLVTPLANWMEKKGAHRLTSTIMGVFLVMIVLSLFVIVIALQAGNLSKDMPLIKQKGSTLITNVENYIESQWDIPVAQQIKFAKSQGKEFMQSSGSAIRNFLTGFTGMLGGIVLIIVFMFLLLYQREKYETFLLKLYNGSDPDRAQKVLSQTAQVAQYYLIGRLISIVILTVLYAVGLLILGVKNAFLLSVIAAILTLIPYLGTIIGSLFPFAMALITEDTMSVALWTLGVMVFVQALDNYFIEPYVVGGEVNISGFFTILILAVGGFIWGVAGMILFIPMLGIAKIVFDNFDELQPMGYLVGDQEKGRQSERILEFFKSLFKK